LVARALKLLSDAVSIVERLPADFFGDSVFATFHVRVLLSLTAEGDKKTAQSWRVPAGISALGDRSTIMPARKKQTRRKNQNESK
jgi:hypothetical protein